MTAPFSEAARLILNRMSVEEAVRRGLLVSKPVAWGRRTPDLTDLQRRWCARWLGPMQT